MKPRTIAQWAMDKQREETNRTLRLMATKIPERYWDLSWDDYDSDSMTSDGEVLRDVLIDFVENWKPTQSHGLVILGPAGYGKTLGALILGVALTEAGVWVKYVTEDRLAEARKRLINLSMEAEEAGDWGDFNTAAMSLAFIETECDVLILDDIGKAYRSATKFADRALDSLLRRRQETGKVTIMTSNLLHEDWKKIDGSMASFLYDIGEIVNIVKGKDYRARPSAALVRRRATR